MFLAFFVFLSLVHLWVPSSVRRANHLERDAEDVWSGWSGEVTWQDFALFKGDTSQGRSSILIWYLLKTWGWDWEWKGRSGIYWVIVYYGSRLSSCLRGTWNGRLYGWVGSLLVTAMQANVNANAHNKIWIYDCVIGASGLVREERILVGRDKYQM